MDTTERVISTGRRRRRQHSAFSGGGGWRLPATGRIDSSGGPVARVEREPATSLGAQAERGGTPIAIEPTRPRLTVEGGEGFLPVTLSSCATESTFASRCAGVKEGERAVAGIGGTRVCAAAASADEVIRIDAAWIAVEPLDMRAGVDTALARVVSMFGEARSHHAYLFMNRRANRLKVLVHDGFGLWLCARRLQQGHFIDRARILAHALSCR